MIYIAYPSQAAEDIKDVFQSLEEAFEITTPKDRHKLTRYEFAEKSEELLKKSSIFIAEASYPSTGVEIEATWAIEHDIPILLFVKKGKDYLEALKDHYVKVRHYSSTEELKEKLYDFLTTEYPGESKQEYFQYSDKEQYKSHKKGWERKYK
ncbi:MAG: hypothetical protein GF368_02570 [Candidatus Aenigmarchaeota archaeon]|nr:hypothetical protein [Candidatus Aenigmarchaeota archaeon]